jgi:hypothetical protein
MDIKARDARIERMLRASWLNAVRTREPGCRQPDVLPLVNPGSLAKLPMDVPERGWSVWIPVVLRPGEWLAWDRARIWPVEAGSAVPEEWTVVSAEEQAAMPRQAMVDERPTA